MKIIRGLYLSFAVILPCLLTLFGCSTVSKPKPDGGRSDSQQAVPPVGTYRSLALRYEASRQFPKALFAWRLVDNLLSGDKEAKERIAQLQQTIQAEGNRHLTQGKEYLQRKSFQEARRQFAIALAYNPLLTEAADHVRRLSLEDEFVEYEVKPGDDPERIAQTVYRDTGRQFIVTYFAELVNDKEMRPGRILRLPAPDQETRVKPVHGPKAYRPGNEMTKAYGKAGAEAHYAKGVAYYLEQQFREAIKEWEETLRLDPEHPNAKRDMQKARIMLKRARSK